MKTAWQHGVVPFPMFQGFTHTHHVYSHSQNPLQLTHFFLAICIPSCMGPSAKLPSLGLPWKNTLEYQVIRRHFFMVYLLKDDNPRLVVNLAHLFQNVLSSPELFQTQWPAFLLAAVEPALLPKCLSSWFHLWHLPSLLPPSSRPPSAS